MPWRTTRHAIYSFDMKNSVRVATAGSITLSGTQTIDGVSVQVGDRVLVKNQSGGASHATNGIYTCATGSWVRATDTDFADEVTSGLVVYVSEGTANQKTFWALTTADPITVGTTALAFERVSGPTDLYATGTLTEGSVLFAAGATTVSQDNTNLFWDNTNKRLGIGGAPVPGTRVTVTCLTGGAESGVTIYGASGQTAEVFGVYNNSLAALFLVNPAGDLAHTPRAVSGGSPELVNIIATNATHTGLAAAAFRDVYVDLTRVVTFTGGASTDSTAKRGVEITAPTFAATTGAHIFGIASTMRVGGAPSVSGANLQFTVATGLEVSGQATIPSKNNLTACGLRITDYTLTLTGTTTIGNTYGIFPVYVSPVVVTNGSACTVSDSASVRIAGAPVAQGSVTFNNSRALWVTG